MKRKLRKEVLISDLSVARPKSALADRYVAGKWKLLPYEADKFSGVMLGAVGSRDAAPVKLPLKVRGWYEIYVAFYPTFHPCCVRLRLSSDRAYRKFTVEQKYDFTKLLAEVEERFWKAADLTGESIQIAPYKITETTVDNYIAYVRLVPLSPAKVRALKKDRKRKDTKRLIAMSDGGSIVHSYPHMNTKKAFAEEVDVYKNTDFRGICWEFIKGDTTRFFPVPGVADYPVLRRDVVNPGEGYAAIRRVFEEMVRKRGDYLRIIRELTRSAGLELHVSHRMIIAAQPPAEESHPPDFTRGKFDDYCRHADGTPVSRLSYAKPDVCERISKIYARAAEYGVDGLHMLTIRGGPMVMYEDEMVERFRELYGTKVDPRTLPVEDRRIFNTRGVIFGDFLRRLRKTVRASARKKGHKPPILAMHTLCCRDSNRHFGFDLASWAREGLLDMIVAGPWGQFWGKGRSEWPDADMAYFRKCIAGTRTKLYVRLARPSSNTTLSLPEYYRHMADKFYKHGAEGLFFWDTNARHPQAEHFDVLSVLGHKRSLPKRIAEMQKKSRSVPLKTLLGLDLARARFPAWLGG